MTDSTTALATYCVDRAETPLTADVREQLEQHLLDWLGVVVGGAAHADSTPAVLGGLKALGPAAHSAAADGLATVIPTGERVPPDHAALVTGTLAHSLDFDDTHRMSSLHPGAPVIAAALATAEAIDASTDRLLRAIAAGYDVACTVGEAVNTDAHYDRGFHITATCGTFGATAAAGIVRGLTTVELENAFGVNGSQAAGSLQFLANGAWNKRLHPGLAAQRAVTATALAEAGFEAAADPLEGEYGFFAAYTDDPHLEAFDRLDDRDAVVETALKPYPCCRYMHAALDALADLAPKVEADRIEAIEVALPAAGIRLTGDPIEEKRRPSNFVDCQFSMPFGAALTLTRGDASFASFLAAQSELEDLRLRALMAATTVTTDEEVSDLFPDQWAARVVVETTDGTHERFVESARGDPETPMSRAATLEKVRDLVEAADQGGVDVAELEAVVGSLERRSVEELVSSATWE
ncbi:MmgE/PrpD family protein [Natronobeatus ordinarius]|uniref:MmgE/PrpD family protein n=1 Tax=Natronobeatus ordinarius TaxID=2963433 RepID=UPI0020CBFD69|nr:MmgE/PrpD family protein [Natronobeatus ordinarius]